MSGLSPKKSGIGNKVRAASMLMFKKREVLHFSPPFSMLADRSIFVSSTATLFFERRSAAALAPSARLVSAAAEASA